MSQNPPPYVPAQPPAYGAAAQQAPPQSQTQVQTAPGQPPAAGPGTDTLVAGPSGATPAQRAGVVAAEARTAQNTPRLIVTLMAISLAAALLLGATGGWQLLSSRQASLAAAHDTEQLLRVQSIQTDLLRADAIATNAFLVGGLEPEAQRADYDTSIAEAAQLIAEAAEAQSADRAALEELNVAVTDYGAQIELARSNNRQGYPVGAEYLKQASAELRATAMPLLDNLVTANSSRAESELASNGPVVLVVVGLICVAAMAAASVLAARRFRRIVNPGLALGLGLMLVALIVGGATLSSRSSDGQEISAGSFDQVRSLSTARISGNDAKAYESLTLIARGSGAGYQKSWEGAALTVTGALAPGSDVRRAWDAYGTQHVALRKADDGGDWDSAVASSIGDGDANTAFSTFDTTTKAALDAASVTASADLARSGRGTLPGAIVVMLLCAAAAVLSAWGLSRRMREYQ